MNTDTPAQVAESLKRYLRTQGTLQEAAERLGVGPTTLSNQLNGKKYFTRKNAVRYAAIFDVNPNYLVTGQGELRPDFKEPRNLFTLGDADAGDTLEGRIVAGIRAQVLKLDELAHTYNNLLEHIKETAGYIDSGSLNYDYCQKVIHALEGKNVKPVAPWL